MRSIVLALFVLSSLSVFGQKKVEKVQIQTTAECESCKMRIEGKLNYTKGIRFAELDVPSKVLTVQFQSKKIGLDQIRAMVSDLGYDADAVKANPKSYEALPSCCKVGGMSH